MARDKHDCFFLSSEGRVLAVAFIIDTNWDSLSILLQLSVILNDFCMKERFASSVLKRRFMNIDTISSGLIYTVSDSIHKNTKHKNINHTHVRNSVLYDEMN